MLFSSRVRVRIIGLVLDFVSGWYVVMKTYLCYFRHRGRSQICYQDGVNTFSVSNVEIGFPLFLNWKLS